MPLYDDYIKLEQIHEQKVLKAQSLRNERMNLVGFSVYKQEFERHKKGSCEASRCFFHMLDVYDLECRDLRNKMNEVLKVRLG